MPVTEISRLAYNGVVVVRFFFFFSGFMEGESDLLSVYLSEFPSHSFFQSSELVVLM